VAGGQIRQQDRHHAAEEHLGDETAQNPARRRAGLAAHGPEAGGDRIERHAKE